MKEQILKLRNEGKSYREIEKILGCSRSTISYHCGDGSKDKCQARQRKLRRENCLLTKLNTFKGRKDKRIYDKVCSFQRANGGRKKIKREKNFSIDDVLKKVGESPKCYLTGRTIDIQQPRTYSFDHVIPRSRGGKNELDNLELACKEVNIAKNDLFVDEFLKLCIDTLEHNGYTVVKK
jgi:5-methylcytosine-specific restriction endonuclease McrA